MNWKTVGGHCIYRFEKEIYVLENLFFRWLKFNSEGIQTLIFKPLPHKFGLEYIPYFTLAIQKQPGTCCLLGLGGAGVAHSLSTMISEITAVEISQEVISIAKNFFKLDKIPQLKIIEAEAALFIETNNTVYTHILIDLFTKDSFPVSCMNIKFFENCKNSLEEQGVLAINIANSKEHRPIFLWIRKLFGFSTVVIPIKHSSNLIILAYKNLKSYELINNLYSTINNLKLVWDPSWGTMVI